MAGIRTCDRESQVQRPNHYTDSSNYCGIALSSIFGKVFHRIVINRYYDVLASSALQFSFKKRHSISMCTLVMKETELLCC